METFDPRDVVVNVNGTIITGFAEGSFVKAVKNEDSFTPYVGAQGETSTAEKADNTGKLTVTVQNTSPSYIYLNKLAKQKTPFPANVVDRNSGITYGGTECRIMKPADVEFSNQITERTFDIWVADYKAE